MHSYKYLYLKVKNKLKMGSLGFKNYNYLSVRLWNYYNDNSYLTIFFDYNFPFGLYLWLFPVDFNSFREIISNQKEKMRRIVIYEKISQTITAIFINTTATSSTT